MKTIINILLLVTMVSQTLSAQQKLVQNIKGTVTDEAIEIPLIGATVVLQRTNPPIGTITDQNGVFFLENVSVGKIAISVSYIGYEPVIISNIDLNSAKETILKIKLKEQIYQADEVVIKANSKDRPVNELAYASSRSFTIEETQRYAGSLSDPSRMAGNYAGVVSANDNRNDIIIRGNSPMGLLWRLEGIDIPNPNHFAIMGTTGGPVSILNNNVLANSDFLTSAFPAEYGNSTSGVFDLKLRNGNNQNREYSVQMSYNGYEIGAEGPFSKNSKASYLINARYSQVGLMDELGIAPEEIPAIPNFKDISYKVNIPLKKGRLSFFGIGGISDIAYEESDMEESERMYRSYCRDNYLESNMGISGVSFVHFFNNNTSLKSNLAISIVSSANEVDSSTIEIPDKIITRDNNSSEIKYSFASTLKHKINKRNFIKTGINMNVYQMNYTDSILSSYNDYFLLNDINGEMAIYEAFTQYEHKFTNKLSASSGIHLQYLSLNNKFAIEPRLALKYKIKEKHSINIGYGNHSQIQARPVYFLESEINGQTVKTNKDLGYAKTHHFVAGYDYVINENLRLKLETYYQYLYNVAVSTEEPGFSMINAGADFEIPLKENLVNEGTGENYGIEFTLEHFYNKNFYFLGTLSLFNSTYKGYDNIKRNTEYNSNYVCNLLGGYDFKIGKYSKLSVNLKSSFSGGKRYMPVLEDESIQAGYIIYDWDNAYENQRESYFRTDMTIRYKLNRKRTSHEIGMEFQNLTNQKNVFTEYFDISSGTNKKEYQVGFFFIPTYILYF